MVLSKSQLKLRIAESILSQALGLLGYSPEGIYRILVKAFGAISKTEYQQAIANWLCQWFSEGPGATWLHRVLYNLHPNVRKRFLAHTIVDLFFRSPEALAQYKAKHGIRPPPVMLISPTMRCNYKCEGCYAAYYTKKEDMPFELFDRVLTEAENLFIKFFAILGGEPFLYEPLLEIFKKHSNSPFQVFTNGSLIDREVARRLVELGNVAVVISIEGLEEETDFRRGRGAFERCLKAMDNLREAGCLFGFSSMVTRNNVDIITSDEFIDFLIERGTLYGWWFLYLPIGRNPNISEMPTPEDRNRLRIANKRFRKTKPILIGDFWNDGALAGGCISGARSYFHINHKGDVEPCIFVHFATHNIRDCSLEEALNSPFFKAFRRMQPFCYNTLRPCPIIDHPKILRSIIKRYNAYPTHEGAESLFGREIAEGLDRYAEGVKEIMDRVWEEEYSWAGKWLKVMEWPEGRIEARRKGFELRKKSLV